jgi:two-component system cell cycle sensor histidine kinase PleC
MTTHLKKGQKQSWEVLLGEEDARFITDESGAIIHSTDGFAALTGLAADKSKGRPLSDLVKFEDPDAVARGPLFGVEDRVYIDIVSEGVHKVRFPGKRDAVAYIRFDKIAAADSRRYLVGSASLKEEDAGSPFVGAVRSFLDENARPPAAPGAELPHFMDMSHEVMAVSGRDGHFARVNAAFTKVLGYSGEELKAMRFVDLVHAEDRVHIRASLQSVMRDDAHDGRIIDFETRVTAKDGGTRWIEWRQKRSNDAIYSVGRDVTAMKSHEAALRKQEQQLSEAQAIGHMGHWYWKVGAETIEWSDEIYRIFGVARGTFRPGLESVNALLHKRDIGRMMQAFQRAIIEKNNYEMEFRVLRPGGDMRYIRCEGRCELDDGGDVISLFGVMQDITERTIYETDLRDAKEAAERAYAAKSQFLANMSHELRTPLNAIIGFSEMMQRQLLGPIGTEKYIDYIAGIRESGEHLLDLISDILDMSKIEAGKYELDLEELNVGKIIRLAAHMMEGRAQDAKIKISIDVRKEDMLVVADRRAFMQILLNLLSNAVKFTDPGGLVRIECIERPDYLSIKVCDNGIGIPANKLKLITRPFEQAASHYTRDHQGTGLGLAITKDLIELHGGSLHIDSTVGAGTTVTVRMPYDAYVHVKNRGQE